MPVKELYQNTYMISLRHGLHGLFYSYLMKSFRRCVDQQSEFLPILPKPKVLIINSDSHSHRTTYNNKDKTSISITIYNIKQPYL